MSLFDLFPDTPLSRFGRSCLRAAEVAQAAHGSLELASWGIRAANEGESLRHAAFESAEDADERHRAKKR